MDNAGNLISGNCGVYDVQAIAASTDPTFYPFNAPTNCSGSSGAWTDGGYYKKWTAVTVDLTSYVGAAMPMSIQFITQDCTLGGHFGYAYIDASCSELQTQVIFCPNDNVVAIAAPLGFNTYQWYDSLGVAIPAPQGTSDTLLVYPPHLVVGNTFSVTMSTVAGCGSSLTATLAHTNMTAYHNITNVSCHGVNDGLAYINQSGALPPFTYTWIDSATSANVTPAIQPDSLTNAHPGTYYVSVTTAGGCFAYDTVRITEPPALPIAHIGTPFCPNDAQVTLSAPAGSNYAWYAGSAPTGTVLGTASTFNVTSPVLGQVFTVNYKPAAGGCANALADSLYYSHITVQSSLTVNDSCFGLNDGSAIVNVSGLPGSTFTYVWDNGTPPAITTTTDTLLNIGPGTYTVTATSPGGCANTATFVITQPAASPPDTLSAHICPHDAQVTLSAHPGSNYQWYSPSGTQIPAPAGTGATYVAANPAIGQVYTVIYTPTNAYCSASTKFIFTLYTLNQPPSSSNPASCYGYGDGSASIIQPTSNPAGASGPFTYSWIDAANSSSVSSGLSASNLFAGTYYVTATTAGGCVTADTVHVTQPPNNFDSLKLTTKYCPGDEPITLHAPPGYSNYTWYGNSTASGTPLQNSSADTLLVPLPIVGTPYVVEMPNPAGGSSCNIVIINTLQYSLPPPPPNFITNTNVFSPNGDGKNDFFLLNQTSYQYIKEFHLEVYNRWGKKVYETNDFTSQWDGKDKSNAVDEGVYYWIATYTQACLVNAPTITAKGFVQVVK